MFPFYNLLGFLSLQVFGSFVVYGMAELTEVPELPSFDWLLGSPKLGSVGLGLIGWPLVGSTGSTGSTGSFCLVFVLN